MLFRLPLRSGDGLSRVALASLALWACGGNTGPNGVPTRIVFQYGETGGLFDDSVPVTPGTVLLIRATPADAEGHTFTTLTENWSVAGGGTLDGAVTSPAGDDDATLNRWSTGSTSGVQTVTVTLPAYPGVSTTIHVRAVNLQMVRVSPDTAIDLTLALGQTVSLTVQLRTAEGQPFVWPVIFSAGIFPSYPCAEANAGADFGSFTPSGQGAGRSDTLSPDSQGKATALYKAPTLLSVQGPSPGSDCGLAVGAGATASPGGLPVNASVSWVLHQTPGPPAHILAVGGDGQAASPGAMLPLPLRAQVVDAYGNPLAGISVTWAVTSGGGSLSATMTTTDGSGRSSVQWTVGLTSGTQAVSASIAGGISVGFTASVS
jgi:Big-like domain-containing protein